MPLWGLLLWHAHAWQQPLTHTSGGHRILAVLLCTLLRDIWRIGSVQRALVYCWDRTVLPHCLVTLPCCVWAHSLPLFLCFALLADVLLCLWQKAVCRLRAAVEPHPCHRHGLERAAVFLELAHLAIGLVAAQPCDWQPWETRADLESGGALVVAALLPLCGAHAGGSWWHMCHQAS